MVPYFVLFRKIIIFVLYNRFIMKTSKAIARKGINSDLYFYPPIISIGVAQSISMNDRPKISGSKDLYDCIIRSYTDEVLYCQEQFWALYLNRANKIIGAKMTSMGNRCGTVVDPVDILRPAINLPGCQGIALSHNHPSGGLEPSSADIKITEQVKKAAEMFNLTLLDHIIVHPDRDKGLYYSFADEGRL